METWMIVVLAVLIQLVMTVVVGSLAGRMLEDGNEWKDPDKSAEMLFQSMAMGFLWPMTLLVGLGFGIMLTIEATLPRTRASRKVAKEAEAEKQRKLEAMRRKEEEIKMEQELGIRRDDT